MASCGDADRGVRLECLNLLLERPCDLFRPYPVGHQQVLVPVRHILVAVSVGEHPHTVMRHFQRRLTGMESHHQRETDGRLPEQKRITLQPGLTQRLPAMLTSK